MVKIIAFSGSHGVGKTSLIQKISNDAEHKNIKIFHENNTGLFNLGYALNGKGIDFDEVMFSQEQAFMLGYNLIKHYTNREHDSRTIFLDRSCIDTLIYSCYFANKEVSLSKEHQNILRNMEQKSLEIIDLFDTVLLPPFNDFSDCENRLGMLEQGEIWQLFLDFFEKKSSKYTILNKDNTADRYLALLNIIQKSL